MFILHRSSPLIIVVARYVEGFEFTQGYLLVNENMVQEKDCECDSAKLCITWFMIH